MHLRLGNLIGVTVVFLLFLAPRASGQVHALMPETLLMEDWDACAEAATGWLPASTGCEDPSRWRDNIVWGTGWVEMDNIVWGTVWDVGDDNIVWGTDSIDVSLEHGGKWTHDNIVWGTLWDDSDNIVWGTGDAASSW